VLRLHAGALTTLCKCVIDEGVVRRFVGGRGSTR